MSAILVVIFMEKRRDQAASKGSSRRGTLRSLYNLASFFLGACLAFDLQLGLLYLQSSVDVFEGNVVYGNHRNIP